MYGESKYMMQWYVTFFFQYFSKLIRTTFGCWKIRYFFKDILTLWTLFNNQKIFQYFYRPTVYFILSVISSELHKYLALFSWIQLKSREISFTSRIYSSFFSSYRETIFCWIRDIALVMCPWNFWYMISTHNSFEKGQFACKLNRIGSFDVI